ncbi:GNAT family N-acetyltransferase [Ruminococcus sp. OA3]|uniref:GNAT family N-acetyltransferase n=1 Tax=Ruminococcus sp. OA3 TaxID=2914164 RepID=UPI001F06C0FF|nr:GNAT family N-acetyltransferase [Ruminococcus sp. OA3]MCH1981226.1 GNAT family N-acetyltransferase [Ruminococcus sp. OA3]
MTYTIRRIQKSEYPLLNDFLYEAIFVPDGVEPPPRSILMSPDLQVYVDHFGESKDDIGLVTEVDEKIVGAVWVRIMDDYGHVDDRTPSFAISLYKEYRGLGIGTAMMRAMLTLLKHRGYKRASLAVQKANYAVKMYLRVGFRVVEDRGEEFVMVIDLAKFS